MNNRKQIIIAISGAFLMGAIIGWAITEKKSDPREELEHEHVAESSVFTCSMHPQIRQDEPGKCPICGMDLVPVSSANKNADLDSPYLLQMSSEAVALANISTTTVSEGEGGFSTDLNGKVEADERRISSVSANFSGRVDELFVAFTGQEVKKGERLARIYSPALITANQELIEAKKSKDISPKLYEAAKQKLRHWQLTDSQIEQMEMQGDYRTHFDIFASSSGVVSNRNIAVGDYVEKGQVLFEIIDLSKVWIMLDAYENNIGSIEKGDLIDFKVNALPNQDFKAKVSFIDPVLGADSRSVKVRAEVNNSDGLLKPEMLVTATVSSSNSENGSQPEVMIPSSAILWTGERSVVYRQVGSSEKPAFEMVVVTLGPASGNMQSIKSGLEIGDKIVTNGVFAVDGAAQLSGKYSMMSHPESQPFKVDDRFLVKLDGALDAYLALKNQLVSDQSAQQQAKVLVEEIKEIEGKELSQEATVKWKGLKNAIVQSALKISSGLDIEEERNQFVILSNKFIELVEAFGTHKEVVYKSHCPMAKNDQGAFWLSEFAEIKNPYFGSSMLGCGEVKKAYRKNQE
ncbi:efflux RND transporter periplasmic adaptor subunit [Echinicola sp. CAU 1574]|uniref:Efflux RND transporter periplasmic adaptor subunit n=1 Tax=Echinicola arenosa TaxID=2774144 RepID=A0ABR9AF97_9BACT|nr:efflux RND transporter periplasmic adaptor subunit [Echinicola arenosa]MBD8487500.1 efflux RND transporter periplasmic adaptor subunit [Echinicola arenosa]